VQTRALQRRLRTSARLRQELKRCHGASGMVALSCGIRQCFATNSATTTTREALPRLTFHSVRMPLFLGYPRVGTIAYTFGGLATSAKVEVLNGNVRFWREAVMQTPPRRQRVDTRPFPHRTTSRPGWGIIEVSKSLQHSGFLLRIRSRKPQSRKTPCKIP